MIKLDLQFFAHKKGVGSTKNGRDSESKRLGVKRADGQFVLAGNILVFSTSGRFFTGPCRNLQGFLPSLDRIFRRIGPIIGSGRLKKRPAAVQGWFRPF